MAASMTSMYDWCKENSYYFLGPHMVNRLWACIAAVTVGTLITMPFDAIRVRLQTMRPLPNGVMPYNGILDCLTKILKYESSSERSSTVGSLYAGLEAYWLRLFLICYLSMYILDYYHANSYQTEFW